MTSAIVPFETWLETGDESLLAEIERLQRGGLPLDLRAPRVAALASGRQTGRGARRPTSGRRARKRSSGTRSGPRSATGCSRARRKGSRGWLLAHLLDYHQREARPQWWEWFRHPQLDEDELIEDRTAPSAGSLGRRCRRSSRAGATPPRMSFRPQEHKISGEAIRPGDASSGYRARVDDEHRRRHVLRGVDRADEPLPTALDARPPARRRRQARRADAVRARHTPTG